jgi:DNA-binding NarL/FixJ family response regulator
MRSDKEQHISITIVEDNRYVREGWIAVFENVPNFTVRGAFANCEKAFRSQAIAESDVVLMDIGLPGMSGIEGARYITEHYPGTATVMCTVFEDDQKIFDALCAGAVGYLLKEVDSADLIRAIRDATAGGSPMTPDIARKVIAHFQKPTARLTESIEKLTERERDTLNLLAQGKSYAEIGEQLFISIDAVRSRIRTIYVKLQSHSRGEAVAKGLAHRIISLPDKPPDSPR